MNTQTNGEVVERSAPRSGEARFPAAAGVFLGLGLGGFFDGIVFHQILQWHHMVSSAGYPPTSLENMRLNVLADGLFHAATYLFTLVGIALLWRGGRRPHARWSTGGMIGAVLVGFGLFNLVEGIVNHHVLGIHHVNETVPREQWPLWDIGFLIVGAVLVVVGALLWRGARRRLATPSPVPPGSKGTRGREGRRTG